MSANDFLEKNKTKLLAAAAIAATGALIWTLLSSRQKEDIKDKVDDAKKKVEKEVEQLYPPLTTPRSEADVKVGYIEGTKILDKETLANIHSLIARRMSSRYIRKAIEARKERRKHIDDIQRYIRDCDTLQEQIGHLIHQITARILQELKLEADAYQTAFEYHAKKEPNQDYLDRVAQPDSDIIPSATKLDKQKIIEMYDYQKSILEEVISELVVALGKHANHEQLDYLVDFRLLDLTAMNLGIEEEDLLNKFNFHYSENPEIKEHIKQRDNRKGQLITTHS